MSRSSRSGSIVSDCRARSGFVSPRSWWVGTWILAAILSSGATGVFAAEPQAATSSELPRHELELRALVEPELVRSELPALEKAASREGDHRQVALLALARANACRVIADWSCQQEAGATVVRAADAARDRVLLVRGLIAEARARMALQDYSRGERLLGRAELELEEAPNLELLGDIALAYSSLSFSLGKVQLSAEYAERGLAQLGGDVALPLQVRLMRNLSRALAQTGRPEDARTILDRALLASERFVDPKLRAELSLEVARLARRQGDLATQRRHGGLVLELGQQLANSQVKGLGHEVLGLAAQDAGDWGEARQQFELSGEAFGSLGLTRDELRATRQLLVVLLGLGAGADELAPRVRRLLELDQEVAASDRAQAADSFEARLEYARQELAVLRLESEAALATERARALTQRIRLNRVVGALGALTVLVLAVFFWLQRRSNQRLRATMEALQQSDARATDLLQLSTGYLFLHNTAGRIIMVNPAAASALGVAAGDLVGTSLLELAAPGKQDEWSGYLNRVATNHRDEGTLPVRRRDGALRAWRYTSRTSPAEVHQRYVIGQAVDVTEEVERSEALRQASLYDALTSCYNRRYLHEFEHDHLGDHSWGVLYFDLDGFKRINDTRGHEQGDEILKAFAKFLLERVRSEDAVVRIGGDEFVILLARGGATAVRAQVDRLREDAGRAPTAFSMGHAVRSGKESLSETLARADSAMYQSRGRDTEWDRADLGN